MSGYTTPKSPIHPRYRCNNSINIKRYRFDYEKPRIVKLDEMNFPVRIIEAVVKGQVCKQCSSCHSCR